MARRMPVLRSHLVQEQPNIRRMVQICRPYIALRTRLCTRQKKSGVPESCPRERPYGLNSSPDEKTRFGGNSGEEDRHIPPSPSQRIRGHAFTLFTARVCAATQNAPVQIHANAEHVSFTPALFHFKFVSARLQLTAHCFRNALFDTQQSRHCIVGVETGREVSRGEARRL